MASVKKLLYLSWHSVPWHSLQSFLAKNVVMLVAFAAAVLTACIVPPDGEYWSYFDLKTLTCLFCVLAVVCALKNIRFFYIMAQKIVACFRNARLCGRSDKSLRQSFADCAESLS